MECTTCSIEEKVASVMIFLVFHRDKTFLAVPRKRLCIGSIRWHLTMFRYGKRNNSEYLTQISRSIFVLSALESPYFASIAFV